MPQKYIYFDYNSSTPMVDDAITAMKPYAQTNFFNISAKYAGSSKQDFLNAKQSIIKHLNAPTDSRVVFYGGGTEAASSAISGVFFYNYFNKIKKDHFIISQTEHDSGINTAQYLLQCGTKVSYISATATGGVNLDELKAAMRPETALISVMLVNNETGVINDIKAISKFAKEHNILVHCDIIAAVGKMPINLTDLNADIYSIAGHKFYGPKGVGANIITNSKVQMAPLVVGSKQEYGLRAGTENVAGAIGLSAALGWVTNNLTNIINHETKVRDYFEEQLKIHIKDYQINCVNEPRVCNTSSVAFGNVDKNDVIASLASKNICVAGGAASIFDGRSRVIAALNLPAKYAMGTVRFSFGYFSSCSEVDEVFKVLPQLVNKM